jgi:phospholipid/cholesterol/gamma-HCH transport system substrate-binding protein
LPSQHQLRWSQLRVGLTVLIASITLGVLIFLMSGSKGLFTKKLIIYSYFDNAGGLRVGAPVRLQGVDIGNVTSIGVVPNRKLTPVQVAMKVSRKFDFDLHTDSLATLATAGVLGETFVDIDSTQAKGPPVQNGGVLETREKPDIQDVVRSSQSTLQNMQVLLQRVDRIVTFVESGQGSIGKLIYDEELYKRLNTSVNEVQTLVAAISQGKGSIGKLVMSDELYVKANDSIDKLNKIVDEVNSGQGSAGKFLKDPALYNNANQTIAKANQLMGEINAGKGALGKFASDQAFAAKVDNTVTKLSLLADRLEAGQGSAGKLLNDPSLYNNADHMLVESRNLIQSIREHPKRYLTIHFRVF